MRYSEDGPVESISCSFRAMCPYIIITTLLAFALFMGLGVLRLYSFRLECRLNAVNRQIESLTAQRVILKHELSALLSPVRICGISEKELGMTFASNIRVLKVEGNYLASSPAEDGILKVPDRRERENEGWFYFFLEGALAGE